MDDWDRHLPQVMGAYNSTEHSTTGISPHMMLTGHEKALPLTFTTLNMKGREQHRKRTCGMSLEDSRTSITYAGGTRNRRKLDKNGGLIKGLPMQKPTQVATTSGYFRKWFHQKELRVIKEMAWPISNKRSAPRRSVLSTEHRKSSSLRKHQTAQCLIAGLVHPSRHA